MKLKHILLSLLIPVSAFAANTNRFDNVRVNQTLTADGIANLNSNLNVQGAAKFSSPSLFNYNSTMSGITVTNNAASGGANLNVYRPEAGPFWSWTVIADSSRMYATTFGTYGSIGMSGVGGRGMGLFINDGNPSFYLTPTGNAVIKAGDAQNVANTNGQLNVVSTSATATILDLVGFSGQTGDALRVRGSAGSTNLVVTAGGLIRVAQGSIATPSLSFIGDSDTGFHSPAGNTVGVNAGGASVGQWSATGVSSRGFGATVSSISTVTNSIIQPFSGTYSGAPETVTFTTPFASVPTVVATTSESGGTALLNDTIFVTNITVSTCVIGYRTAGGGSSGATITFNGLALGRQ